LKRYRVLAFTDGCYVDNDRVVAPSGTMFEGVGEFELEPSTKNDNGI